MFRLYFLLKCRHFGLFAGLFIKKKISLNGNFVAGAFLVVNFRYNEAANMYEKAAELLPDDFELTVAAATAMRKAGRQEAAERWYRKSVKMKPTVSVFFNLKYLQCL